MNVIDIETKNINIYSALICDRLKCPDKEYLTFHLFSKKVNLTYPLQAGGPKTELT